MLSRIVEGLSRRLRPRGGVAPAGRTQQFESLEGRFLLSLLGIGDQIGLPDIDYDAIGSLVYTADTESFDNSAAPTAITLTIGSSFRVTAPRDFQLHIKVDSAGALVGGVDGPDLLIEGEIDINRDRVSDYSGVLLTGEIAEFGFLNVVGNTYDQFDYRFTPTGGALMTFFNGMDIGLDMTALNSSFIDFTTDFSGTIKGVLGPIAKLQAPPSSLSGRVYVDANNNGIDDGVGSEAGIADVLVTLTGTDDDGNDVDRATITNGNGEYFFEGLAAGTYTITEVNQPEGYIDGIDAAGTLGGSAGNDTITTIITPAGENGTGYTFGETLASSLSGLAYEDFNNDGEIDFGESAIEGVTVTLSGQDYTGAAVNLTTTTDTDGLYIFTDLRAGEYTLTETQPAGYDDGIDTLGTAGGVAGNDVFSEINIAADVDGMNYNFGERPQAGSTVVAGQTATIGFWQNKNGQNLIKALNGGEDATQLGDWLAATFPNMYGVNAGDNNLAGLSNAGVASFYRNMFKAKAKAKGSGPAKIDCQVMAVAFATYVTSSTLADNTAASYGFLVTENGVGYATFNIGDAGAVFGVADGSLMAIIDMLLATDDQAVDGMLYDMDSLLRSLANQVYSAINEAGDI